MCAELALAAVGGLGRQLGAGELLVDLREASSRPMTIRLVAALIRKPALYWEWHAEAEGLDEADVAAAIHRPTSTRCRPRAFAAAALSRLAESDHAPSSSEARRAADRPAYSSDRRR
jgi:hypothetical protein